MTQINGGNKFINGNVSNDQAKSIANRAMSSKENLEALSKEIMADGRVDANEAKVITMVGFYTDESNKSDVKKHFTQPNDSRISDLFERGFELGDKAVKKYEKDFEYRALARNIGSKISGGMINSASKEVKENNKGVMKNLDKTLDSLKTSCERTDCVRVTLQRITGVDIGTNKSQEVTETYLNKVTGVKDKNKSGWDAINASSYNKDGKNSTLQRLLAPYEATLNSRGFNNDGKALVVVGAHTYQFCGFNKDGDMIVKDPSDNNKAKVIGKDNPSVTVYVQKVNGKGGDDGATGRISPDSTAKGFNEFNRAGVSLSSDRMDGSGESKQIRKLLVLIGDKDQNTKPLFDAIKSGNLSEVQKILKSKNINLSDQEVKAFISVMNTTLPNGSSMIKEMEKLRNEGTKSDRCKYLNGIEYSDVNLKDFFTKTPPTAVFDIFQDMVEGKDGC